ncbi:MAG TPA: type II CAAX endopeptidase family protein [Cyclobacteriaceae bacterium]|nr:type II CAAX endopeptidase family protein [Cyclobacteriaceae bacterium]
MIGILIQLGISWALLHYLQKTNLNALGFTPLRVRLFQLVLGIGFAALLSYGHTSSKNYLTGLEWRLNSEYTFMVFMGAVGWCLKSVLFEELIFRGALCYIGFERVGAKITMLFSSVCFGIYHWFTWGVLGDVKMMIISFVMTGLYGWTLAYAYYKTKSILLGTGLHFGWNSIGLIVFSSGTIGNQLLISYKPAGYAELNGDAQTIFFFAQLVGIPVAQYLLIRLILKIKG